MKIVTIVGTRPNFIKAWPVSEALADAGHEELILHTGQHYDYTLSRIFFDELNISAPCINLGVGSGDQGYQTALMLEKIEQVLLKLEPDLSIVYGDTNSTLAGALAAVKLHIKVAHVEAGLRSFNRRMPEEINRLLTDRCSDLLFCPTDTALANLKAEGITRGVHLVGDVMYESVLKVRDMARRSSSILERLGLEPKKYLLATVHRAENTANMDRLINIFTALRELAKNEPVIFPLHPRTRKALSTAGLIPGAFLPFGLDGLRFIEPVGYADMIRLVEEARGVLTDSGGVQKEACWLSTPCVILRDETEWVETLSFGNMLAGYTLESIIAATACMPESIPENHSPLDHASMRITDILTASFG
ncbi:MAG: UDP-N-acetylglucosamine 2-epimerase (non-hydrolyzing) [Desulfobacteraceae bacterium]|nr:MAG: UDP-N-acetylglucosamine 2-epimerase (non-hydrolyzing) [Desulfobacteraceae bacterium]